MSVELIRPLISSFLPLSGPPAALLRLVGPLAPPKPRCALARCGRSMLTVLAAALASGIASAETFHSQDGVVFEGTIRLVVSNAAVCNVLEEKYSEQEYEKLKANQGQPLHLWQVDFAVRNESGREIEYLRASRRVHSEHPPCTNWSGEGPGGGPVLPEPSLLIPIGWSDYYQVLQKPSGMRPGQQERRARYFVVFDGQRPRFGEWDIRYEFADGRGPGGQSGGSTQRGRGPAAAAAGLPPEIQVDLNLRKAEQAVRDGDANSLEVFASIGAFSINSDEGSIGRTVSYSGGVSVPFFRNWSAELDVLTGKVTSDHPGGPDNFYRTRRTLGIASVVRRWCNHRACLFAGSGVGIQRRDSVYRSDSFAPDYTPQDWQEIRPRVFETSYSREAPVYFAPKAGVTLYPLPRLGVRTEFSVAGYHVNLRIGVAYRFH